jgi:hypothetical protein
MELLTEENNYQAIFGTGRPTPFCNAVFGRLNGTIQPIIMT